MHYRFGIFLLVLMGLVGAVNAVSFTASVSPSTTNASQNQGLNFTISDTGAVNITAVNITLPTGFSYAGSAGTNTTSSYNFYSSPIGWINGSSIGLIGNGAAQNFSLAVSTILNTGAYGFNVTVLDANGAYASTNVTLTLTDTQAPAYSGNTSYPTSNSTYVQGQTYWFNSTWTDNIGVSQVVLESNFTGSLTNVTMSNSSSIYYKSYTDLAAGNYVWRMYANDSSGNSNSTPQVVYTIAKATNTLTTYLNGQLNTNITAINNTAVNVTTNATCVQTGCTISIVLDNSATLTSGIGPVQYTGNLTSLGLHNYTISVASNTNYTSSSATYFVPSVPSYSISTSNVPVSFSSSTITTMSIVFNSDPTIGNVTIRGNWTGSLTSYTMTNNSVTTLTYNVTIPAGNYVWAIFGNYSNYIFNLTANNTIAVNGAGPSISLTATPLWTLNLPVQTNVSCSPSTSGITVNLYRNGSAVSNPEIATFKAGDVYYYLCNTTGNQNYSVAAVSNTLIILPTPSTTLSFTNAPSLIQLLQNSTSSTSFVVQNSGGVDQSATLTIAGIDNGLYSIQQSKITIQSGLSSSYIVNFNIGATTEVKDYNGTLTVTGTNATITQSFTLRVLPSNQTKNNVIDSLSVYKLQLAKLEDTYTQLKSQGANISSTVQDKFNNFITLINQTDAYISSGDYFNAYLNIQKIKAVSTDIQNQFNVGNTQIGPVNIPTNVWLIIGGVILVIVIGVLAYLFWPTKGGYNEQGGYSKGREGLGDKIRKVIDEK